MTPDRDVLAVFAATACDNAAVMLQRLAKWILRTRGWTPVGDIPDDDKVVFIAAPHTSNWDGFWLIVYKIAKDVQVSFLAKHTLFWWPLSTLLRSLGAIAIDRGAAMSIVDQLVQRFAEEDRLFLALAPEGTRKWKPYWKTGFYRIARRAGVPMVLAFIDYERKRLGIGITLWPSDDSQKDLAQIRSFYEPFGPRHPELKGPIAFPPDQN